MRGSGKTSIIGCIVLMVSITMWMAAVSAWSHLGMHPIADTIRYTASGEGMAFQDVQLLSDRMERLGQGTVTGWGQSIDEAIEAQLTGASLNVDAVWVDGDISRVGLFEAVRGIVPSRLRAGQCIVDTQTANALFGSVDIIGQTVVMGDDRLSVCAVVEDKRDLLDLGRGMIFLLPDTGQTSVKMRALAFGLYYDAEKTIQERAQALLTSAGMESDGIFDDFSDRDQAMQFVLSLPGCVMTLVAVWWIGQSIWVTVRRMILPDRTKRIGSGIFRVGIMAGIAGLMIKCVRWPGGLPPSMLPTRWSDFGFWTAKAKQTAGHWIDERLIGALRSDMAQSGVSVLCLLMGLIALVSVLWAIGRLRLGSWTSVWERVVGIVFAAMGFILGFGIARYMRIEPIVWAGMLSAPVGLVTAFMILEDCKEEETV